MLILVNLFCHPFLLQRTKVLKMKKVVLLLLLIIAVSVAQKLIIGTANPRKTSKIFSFLYGSLRIPVSTLCRNAFSILNRKIPNQNTMHCVAFLPWFEEINLELAQTACK